MKVVFEKYNGQILSNPLHKEMGDLIARYAVEAQKAEGNLIITTVKEHSLPPIKGEVTINKMKWRGIKIAYRTDIGKRIIKVLQRGVQIGKTIEITFQ